VHLLPLDYAVRNLGRSPLRLVLSVLGAALVVLLILAAGSFVRGMAASLRASGDERNVMILGAGSEESIERSEIPAGAASLIAASIPGLMSRHGIAYVSPEVNVALPVSTSPQPRHELVSVRGITPAALLVHGQVQLAEGRLPIPGRDEVMIGALAARKMGVADADLAPGRSVWIERRPWSIVGRFTAPGTVMDAEIWTPLYDIKAATRRETDSVVIVTLDTAEPADIDAFTKQRLDLELASIPEAEYYARLSRFFAPIRIVAWVTAILIGSGGLLGGLNTMYAAFASRVRELGMLQCLGYRRAAIIASLVQESVLAAAAGTLIAAIIGLSVLDGLSVRFTVGAFGLRVDPPVLLAGLLAGLLLGLIGALPPALRALRLPIPESLKAI
jgi:putative ABC transport system permease protein